MRDKRIAQRVVTRKVKAKVIELISAVVDDPALDVAKLGHVADLVTAREISPSELLEILMEIERRRIRPEGCVVGYPHAAVDFLELVTALPGYVPQEAAEDLEEPAAAERFRKLVEAAKVAVAKCPPPPLVHTCATPQACKRSMLRRLARQVAFAEHLATHIDYVYGTAERTSRHSFQRTDDGEQIGTDPRHHG